MARIPTLEQATAARLEEIRDLVRSGATEHTGRAMRTAKEEGWEATGRRFRGLKHAYPELEDVKYSPSQIARAIERGPHRTKIYPAIYQAVSRAMEREGFEPRRIAPHDGRMYCRHCGEVHSRSQHRFHGPGSFHTTHLFSFGDDPLKNPRRWKFFKENGELRARLVNPPLIIANGEKRKKNMPRIIQMKRNRKGQFVAAHRSNPAPHKHKKKTMHRKNWYGAGAVAPMMNAHHKTKRRRNPPTEFLGIPLPNFEEVIPMSLGFAGGLAGPPITQGLLTGLMPTTIAQSLGTFTPTLIKVVSYVLPPVVGYAVAGRQAVKYVVAGELAALVIVPLLQSLTASISTSLLPAGTQGYVSPNRTGFQGFGRGPAHGAGPSAAYGPRRLLPGMRGYITPTARGQLSAFPGVRSLSRATRFVSPRR